MPPSVFLRRFAADDARAVGDEHRKPVVSAGCNGVEHGTREGAVEADGAGGDGAGGDSAEDSVVPSRVKDKAALPVCIGGCEGVMPRICCRLNDTSPE